MLTSIGQGAADHGMLGTLDSTGLRESAGPYSGMGAGAGSTGDAAEDQQQSSWGEVRIVGCTDAATGRDLHGSANPKPLHTTPRFTILSILLVELHVARALDHAANATDAAAASKPSPPLPSLEPPSLPLPLFCSGTIVHSL